MVKLWVPTSSMEHLLYVVATLLVHVTKVMCQIHQYWMATICKHEGKKRGYFAAGVMHKNKFHVFGGLWWLKENLVINYQRLFLARNLEIRLSVFFGKKSEIFKTLRENFERGLEVRRGRRTSEKEGKKKSRSKTVLFFFFFFFFF